MGAKRAAFAVLSLVAAMPAQAQTPAPQKLDVLRLKHDISWHWVKGHAGHDENERADELAREGMAPFKKKA